MIAGTRIPVTVMLDNLAEDSTREDAALAYAAGSADDLRRFGHDADTVPGMEASRGETPRRRGGRAKATN
jgi:hypothetical protein